MSAQSPSPWTFLTNLRQRIVQNYTKIEPGYAKVFRPTMVQRHRTQVLRSQDTGPAVPGHRSSGPGVVRGAVLSRERRTGSRVGREGSRMGRGWVAGCRGGVASGSRWVAHGSRAVAAATVTKKPPGWGGPDGRTHARCGRAAVMVRVSAASGLRTDACPRAGEPFHPHPV